MSLAARRSTRQREDFVMRLGCFLVSFAVLASLILEPPRAKAFAMTSSAVTALASGFLSSCGLTPVVSGMGSSEEVNESVARLIQDFLDEEHPGLKDAVDWIGDAILTVNGGRVIIPSETAKRLSAFATWVAGKYGTKAGVNVVYSNQGITFYDGSIYNFSYFLDPQSASDSYGHVFSSKDYALGTPIVFGSSEIDYTEIGLSERYSVRFYKSERYYRYGFCVDGSFTAWRNTFPASISSVTFLTYPLGVDLKSGLFFAGVYPDGSLFVNASGVDIPSDYISSDIFSSALSLDVSDTMQQVLDRLTALEEGQSIALDVGATQSMEIQDILQGILDAILAGELSASAEVVDEAVEPVEPDPPVVPVVPEGLDKLGAALTSRFPFSIPWDVYKGVTLLAAPPKAPYFEVDFMAPIADRVGGWKGSTKIVLDMSEYEIIGQVCRWTSTIGFCLMLASGTKRLIWTA